MIHFLPSTEFLPDISQFAGTSERLVVGDSARHAKGVQ